MSDLKDSMRRAGDSLPPQDVSYERLLARRERKRRNSRLGSAIVAAVVAAGAIGGVVAALSLHGGPSGKGKQVGAGPDLQAGPGQYYYWKTIRPLPDGDVVEELWWGEDGSGKYQVDSTNPNHGVAHDQSWGPSGFPGVRPFETDLSQLSTDASVLLGQLQERTSPGGASPEPDVTLAPGLSPETSSMWRSIQNIIEMGNATPALRAAIFEVASRLPGVEVGTQTTDPVDRPAIELFVVLGAPYGGNAATREDAMWFDPDTHQLLASDGDLGITPSLIVVAGGIVDSRSETVAPGDGFFPAPPPPQPVPGG